MSPMASSTLEIPRPTRVAVNLRTLLARRFAGGFASTLVAQLGVLGLGTFTGVAAARLLGPQGRGELAALILWPSVLVMLFSLGMNQAIVFHTGQQRDGIPEVWTASTLIGLVQSLWWCWWGCLWFRWRLPPIDIWHENYYEHIIRNEKELNRIREYICTNPLRWSYDVENPACESEAWMTSKNFWPPMMTNCRGTPWRA